MTLSIKLASLVLLSRIEKNEKIYDFYFAQTFFRWCYACVTTLDGKTSKCKVRPYPMRESKAKDPKQRKKETKEDYQLNAVLNI